MARFLRQEQADGDDRISAVYGTGAKESPESPWKRLREGLFLSGEELWARILKIIEGRRGSEELHQFAAFRAEHLFPTPCASSSRGVALSNQKSARPHFS